MATVVITLIDNKAGTVDAEVALAGDTEGDDPSPALHTAIWLTGEMLKQREAAKAVQQA